MRTHNPQHEHHRLLRYPGRISHQVLALVLGPIVVGLLLVFVTRYVPMPNTGAHDSISLVTVFLATLHTLIRLVIAYFFALVVSIPIALLVTYNEKTETILLPLFDILESIPILALFPIVIAFFVQSGELNMAAIAVLFLTMVWSLVFTIIGGLEIIPHDIINVAHVFGINGFAFFRRVILPAIVPQIVTGSILSLASGWNIIIVAEVLRTYIPNGGNTQDLFGAGSILVNASASGQTGVFTMTVIVLVCTIGLINILVWQRLLKLSQRFRFE